MFHQKLTVAPAILKALLPLLNQGTQTSDPHIHYATTSTLQSAGFTFTMNSENCMDSAQLSGQSIPVGQAISLFNGLLRLNMRTQAWVGRFKTEQAFKQAVTLMETQAKTLANQ
jgi:hypothetical protein